MPPLYAIQGGNSHARLKLEPVAVPHTYTRWGGRGAGIVDMPEPGDESVRPVIIVALKCRLNVNVIGRRGVARLCQVFPDP